MSERVKVAVTGPVTWDAHELGVIHIDAVDLRRAGWVPVSDLHDALGIIRQLVLVESKRGELTPGSQGLGLALLAWNNASALLHRHGVLVMEPEGISKETQE